MFTKSLTVGLMRNGWRLYDTLSGKVLVHCDLNDTNNNFACAIERTYNNMVATGGTDTETFFPYFILLIQIRK